MKKIMKKIMKLALCTALFVGLSACAASGTDKTSENASEKVSEAVNESSESKEAKEKKIKIAVSFAYPSLDTHKEYYGWYTNMYGVSQALFSINENMELKTLLADSYKTEGSVTEITLKDKVEFSNGKKLTAEMAVKNLERAAEVNKRYAYMKDFEFKVLDELKFSIDTKEVYPTLVNDLASPELGMLDLEEGVDLDSAPVGTGPFVIKEFIPNGDVSVEKNTNYWEKDVVLDGADFIYLKDDDAKLLAMQNGEIDGYISPSATAIEIFSGDEESYKLSYAVSTRLNFAILNEKTLDKDLRFAINSAIDKNSIKEFLGANVSVAKSPFSENVAYGKANDIEHNLENSKKALENAGYTKNDAGIYEKDGKTVNVNIAYYNARGLDTTATLIHEQLQKAGIDSTLKAYEDPDSTYIASGDFDIALYSMISDKVGDPYYFIDATLREGAYFDVGGFDSDKAAELIEKLKLSTKKEERAELANEIVQLAIDDNAFNYLSIFNKVTVLNKGLSNYSENLPFDFYGLNADTDIE
jgi:peptide/nickel ABC transporter periplasmic protein